MITSISCYNEKKLSGFDASIYQAINGHERRFIMEKLFYKVIYDKRLKRSMTILEILYKSKHEVTIKDLERMLGVSKSTVVTTLNFTKTIIPETMSLSINENNVKLYNEDDQSIDIIIIEIAKNTRTFQVLEHAFLEKGLNIHQLADKLFSSESTIRSRIRHINQTLKDFGCSLSYYDVKFVGDEANIRYFAYTYFSEFQEFYQHVWEKELEYCYAIYRNMEKIYQKHNNRLMNFSHSQIIRWLTITKDRVKNDNFVQIDEQFKARISKRQSYQEIKKIYENEITNHLQKTNIPEDESIWAYVVSFNTVIYLPDDNRDLYYEEKDNEPYQENILEIIKTMADILEINIEDRANFYAVHQAYFTNTALLTKISPMFQMGSSDINKYVTDNLGSLYDTWVVCLSELDEEAIFPVFNIHSLAAQLAMISGQFTYTKKPQAKKIVYSFEGEAGFTAYLETLAKTLLPSGVEGIFIHNESITNNLLNQIKPDIVVFNYSLPEKIIDYKILRMSYIPEIQEWTLLKELIINLDFSYSNKKKLLFKRD